MHVARRRLLTVLTVLKDLLAVADDALRHAVRRWWCKRSALARRVVIHEIASDWFEGSAGLTLPAVNTGPKL